MYWKGICIHINFSNFGKDYKDDDVLFGFDLCSTRIVFVTEIVRTKQLYDTYKSLYVFSTSLKRHLQIYR